MVSQDLTAATILTFISWCIYMPLPLPWWPRLVHIRAVSLHLAHCKYCKGSHTVCISAGIPGSVTTETWGTWRTTMSGNFTDDNQTESVFTSKLSPAADICVGLAILSVGACTCLLSVYFTLSAYVVFSHTIIIHVLDKVFLALFTA